MGRNWRTLSLERLEGVLAEIKGATILGHWKYKEGQSAELGKKKSNRRGLNSRFREIEECVWSVCGIWRTVDPVSRVHASRVREIMKPDCSSRTQ